MKTPLIELKNVWRTYYLGDNRLDVLKNINVTINKGEFVSISGPSGSGKSTLMNQIGLLDTPSKGELTIEGKNILSFNSSELASLRGKKIGFIFQQFNLIPTLTALENVTLPAIFQNVSKEERVGRGTKLLTELGLGDRLDHKPNELSGGQQQRVAIARALINDPEIILADEPTGNLDSKSGLQIMELLTRFNQKDNKTIILITHDTHLVKYSDKKITIKDGMIV